MSQPPDRQAPYAAALYLAVVQFLFVTCWTLYVIFLPELLEGAGLSRRLAPWILVADQLVFMVMDVIMGVAADRAARALGRVGPLIVGLTAVSCAAFLLLPQVAGSGLPAIAMAALILVWTATSSALRAPPWVLLGRYAAVPALPWMNALVLTGLAVGGAIAPYLGLALKGVDPRLPFAVSSLALLATTAGLVWIERSLTRRPPAAGSPAVHKPLAPGSAGFIAGCLLLAAAFQVHFSLNSAGQYLRLVPADRLPVLLPVFWIGFNLVMFPGAALAARYGPLRTIAVSAGIGGAAALTGTLAGSLDVLVAAQFAAGGAWGCISMACFTAAFGYGRTGREGLILGLMFGTLAAAALARIAVAALKLDQDPALAAALAAAPVVLWAAGAVLFALLARAAPPRPEPAKTA